MIPRLIMFALAAAGMTMGAGVREAAAVVFTNSDVFPIDVDTRIDSRSPTNNYAESTTVKVVVNGDDGSLVRGLFALPDDVWSISLEDIISVKVWFHLDDDNTGDRTVDLHPLLSSFDEYGATWLSADANHAWSDPNGGGDYDANVVVTADVSIIDLETWYSWDLTASWDGDPNGLWGYGGLLKMDDESSPGAGNMPRAPFTSSDHAYNPLPYVEIAYVPEPGSLAALTLLTVWAGVRRRRS